MTPQEHINAIGAAQIQLEADLDDLVAASKLVEKLARRADKQARRVHFLQDRAQRAFKEAYPDDNVVLFSGGNDKPPVDDPDGPIKP
jgi:hypothetical protein